MASFTSVKSGDWNDPTVWGNLAGGEYPSKTTDEDTVTISSGHTVTYNIDNSSAGTNHRLGTISIRGTFNVDTTQSTYCWMRGRFYFIQYLAGFVCGSYASPLSSAYTFQVEYDLLNNNDYEWLDYNENSCRVDLHGAYKTQKEYLSATASSAQADITFTTIPSDWAVGDRLVILSSSETGTARYTENEEVEIQSISSNTATLTGNLTYSHSAGTMVMNMTRNIRFFATDPTKQTGPLYHNVQMTSENIELLNIGSTYVFRSGASNNEPWKLEGASISNAIGAITFLDSNDGINFIDCNFYGFAGGGIKGNNRNGIANFEGCLFAGITGSVIDNSGNRAPKWTFTNCVLACSSSNGVYSGLFDLYMNNCYFYGLNGYAMYKRYNPVFLQNCFFGEREDGSSQTNASASLRSYNAMYYMNDCKFNDATLISTHESDRRGLMYWSSNHNQVYGDFNVYDGNGTIMLTNDATVYRTTAPSIKMNCERDTSPTPHKIQFKVEASTSYTITIYGKRADTGWTHNPKATLSGCGIFDKTEWTTNDTNWNAVTLTGTTTRAGIIEVIITHYDNGGFFYVDDISIV